MTDPTRPAREVTLPDRSDLRVIDWSFVPGTGSLVLPDHEGQFFLTRLEAGSALTPLGSHDQLLGLLPGRRPWWY